MAVNQQVNIPASDSTVSVSIIDTSARLSFLPVSAFAGPSLKGFDKFDCVAYAFLITHKDPSTGKERKIIFDLGPPKNWQEDLPPAVVETLSKWGAKFDISKYVSEILRENNVQLDEIEAVIWSHAHWDHIGRPSLFPPSTTLITGPGIKEAFAPGYPSRPDSSILAREFEGREVKEVDFGAESTTTIGSFKAIDFFGDGSFYLLEAHGHAIGHLNALARTTTGSSPSFILMGADSYHHAAQLRPSQYLHLPSSIDIPNLSLSPCPGEIFEKLHPTHSHNISNVPDRYQAHFENHKHPEPRKSPFFTISVHPDGSSTAIDVDAARQTITGLQEFDADERVLLISAHDASLGDVIEVFPKKANDWMAKGWKESGRWTFLATFEKAVKATANI